MCSNYNELGEATDEWPIIWYEDFSSNSLNPNHWNLEYWESGRYNNELQAYTPRLDNVYIEEGKLVIQALRENFTYVNYITGEEIPAEFTSARLNTKLKVDFRPLNCGPNQGVKLKLMLWLNFQVEMELGLPFGCYHHLICMDNGHQVVK